MEARDRLIILTAVLALLALPAVGVTGMAAAAYWQWTTTPTYSLAQIRRAVEEHDVVTFEKHVDVDTVASRLIDDLLADVAASSGADDLGAGVVTGMIELVKPRLVQIVKEQTLRLVEDGTFVVPEGDGDRLGHLAKLDPRGAGFQGISSTEVRGKVALVRLSYHDPEHDADFEVELKLRDVSAYWRLVELSNMSEVLEEIEEVAGPGAVANVAGCRQYVQVFNDAPCSGIDLDPVDLCPPVLDLSTCDMTPFYACMAEHVRCRGAFIDVSGQASCAMPSCG